MDTHVWDIACRDYCSELSTARSITPAVYTAVGDAFRDKFGARCGWAHSVLFAAELPGFKEKLPQAIQEEMETFSAAKKTEKLKAKKYTKTNVKKEVRVNDDRVNDDIEHIDSSKRRRVN